MPLVYHAHVYFLPAQAAFAAELRATLAAQLPPGCWLGQLIHREVGPHTRPMFEINFADTLLPAVEALLEQQRGPLPVLLHPELADDLYGHTGAARWLGEALPLKLETLSRG
ncbi:DOPA 4,5-dioxygenase family protein [Vogesella facilis]|uniref:DOPA 4,5-dioxygenase family protein n=1 Tax=Vogesella facilis TaxID=1655232 RepID=A0ABV7RE21_9NEIS